jgi:hypothetical protein
MTKNPRDIGPIPLVVDPARKERCRHDLRAFCKTYFPDRFRLPFVGKRERIAAAFEIAMEGQQVALAAVDRACGATSISDAAALWLALYGHSFYTLVVKDCRMESEIAIGTAVSDLAFNDLLLEDFPEAAYPIRSLEGIRQRAASQICEGRKTAISLAHTWIRLPKIPGAASSGAHVESMSVTGAFAGLIREAGPNLECTRPTFVIVDDPFSEESLRSPALFKSRRETLSKVVPSLGGVGRKIPVVMLLGPEAIAGIARGESALSSETPQGESS